MMVHAEIHCKASLSASSDSSSDGHLYPNEETSAMDGSNNHVTSDPSIREHVSWLSMPNKGQLAVIVIARIAEPLSERSLVSYIFHQLQSFSPTLPSSTIAAQVGVITSVFAAAQCCTGIFWGHAADSVAFGRKKVLIIGLLGSSISAVGMGFSRSFASAVLFRVLAGTMNGNVGVLRTVIAEVVEDKRYQPRAFLLLPMCFNVGVVIGPLLSGFLVHSVPAHSESGLAVRSAHGTKWIRTFPYALSNLVCALVLLCAAIAVFLALDETHPSLRYRRDYGRDLGHFLTQQLSWGKDKRPSYEPVDALGEPDTPTQENSWSDTATENDSDGVLEEVGASENRASFRAMYSRAVVLTLLQNFVCAVHVSAFNTMLFVFLPAPRSNNRNANLPFGFTGGLGLAVEKVAFANTVIGLVGLPLQILLFPLMTEKLGTLRSYMIFLPFSILAYCLLPCLALLPNEDRILWPCLVAILSSQVLSRTFVGPATTVLVNDSVPHPTLRGTVHGLAASCSAGARMIGPSVGGVMLGWSLNKSVGAPFWSIGTIALLNLSLLWGLK